MACCKAKVTHMDHSGVEKILIPGAHFSHMHVDLQRWFNLPADYDHRSTRWPEAVRSKHPLSKRPKYCRKIDELVSMAFEIGPDLILITESWCSEEISHAFLTIPGYEMQQDLRLDREDTAGGRGGGLLVYAKEGI